MPRTRKARRPAAARRGRRGREQHPDEAGHAASRADRPRRCRRGAGPQRQPGQGTLALHQLQPDGGAGDGHAEAPPGLGAGEGGVRGRHRQAHQLGRHLPPVLPADRRGQPGARRGDQRATSRTTCDSARPSRCRSACSSWWSSSEACWLPGCRSSGRSPRSPAAWPSCSASRTSSSSTQRAVCGLDPGPGPVHRLRPAAGQPLPRGAAPHRHAAGGHPAERRSATSEYALGHTMATAGRTVMFSGVTVAISLTGLFFFDASILRAVGAAGVSVVVVALLVALTLVPALLSLAGDRLIRPGITRRIPGLAQLGRRLGDVAPSEGAFSRLAGAVQRRPLLVALGTLAVLLVLAWPVLGLRLVSSRGRPCCRPPHRSVSWSRTSPPVSRHQDPCGHRRRPNRRRAADRPRRAGTTLPGVAAVDPAISAGQRRRPWPSWGYAPTTRLSRTAPATWSTRSVPFRRPIPAG